MNNPILERMRLYDVRPRKELGQHFLVDVRVLERLLACIAPAPGRTIVEFGAGLGVMTQRLLDAGANVIALELDAEMAHILRTELGEHDRFRLVHEDLARVSIPALRCETGAAKIQLVGNLPYQLTSHVLFGVLDLEEHLEDAIFMVQREVAERIVASPGGRDYGILSVLLRAYHDVTIEMRVKPGAFTPPPRVDSAVLRLVPRAAGPALPWSERSVLVYLVKSVFNERRKILRNTLKKFFELDAEAAAACEAASELDWNRRPETLAIDEFVRLLHALPVRAGAGTAEA